MPPNLEFTASINGLEFPDGESLRLKRNTSLGAVELELLTLEAGTLLIRVRLPGQVPPDSVEVVSSECQQIVEDVLNRLSFATRVGIGQARLSKSRLAQRPPAKPTRQVIRYEEGMVHVTVSDAISVSASIESVRLERVLVFGAGKGNEVQSLLSSEGSSDSTHLAFYRDALRATDVRARFILLYSLLQILVGGKQKAVEAWIKHQKPDVRLSVAPEEMQKSRKPGEGPAMETEFTRVRNEIGHASERKLTPAQVLASTMKALPEFDRLVRLAISGAGKAV